jgi:hypothetical protein
VVMDCIPYGAGQLEGGLLTMRDGVQIGHEDRRMGNVIPSQMPCYTVRFRIRRYHCW